jgi:hypothetical protein
LGLVAPLLKPEKESGISYNTIFFKLAQDFARAALIVNSQNPRVTFSFHHRLENEQIVVSSEDESENANGHFSITSKWDASDVEGHTPDLVLEPLIERSGNELGFVYDGERIVHKAVIVAVPRKVLSDCKAKASREEKKKSSRPNTSQQGGQASSRSVGESAGQVELVAKPIDTEPRPQREPIHAAPIDKPPLPPTPATPEQSRSVRQQDDSQLPMGQGTQDLKRKASTTEISGKHSPKQIKTETPS